MFYNISCHLSLPEVLTKQAIFRTQPRQSNQLLANSSDMKRILLISPQPFFQWRGSPIRVSFNIQALAELGYTVDLLTLPIGERREIEGVTIIRVANPFGFKQIPIGPSLFKIFFDVLILFKGMQLIRKNNYLLIHGIEEAGMIAVLLSLLSGSKSIFEKHSDPSSYKKGFLKNILLSGYALIERITVKAVDAVICTGAGLTKQVDDMQTSTRAFHIFDIPSSLVEPSPDRVTRVREELQQQKDEILITFVGSFAIYQGVDLLIASIPQVVQTCPQARFIIIGGTAEQIDERKNILQRQGALDAVSFIGMVAPDTLPNYLSASDILLSPRLSGVNTPLKLLDYLKAGRSIVATDVEANRLILNEDLANLATPDASDMAQKIISLIENDSTREAMGKAGRKLYESTYNFHNYTKKLEACYTFVLQSSPSEVSSNAPDS